MRFIRRWRRNSILQRDVAERALIGVSPEMMIGRDLNEFNELILTQFPAFNTVPSTTASTFRSLAISEVVCGCPCRPWRLSGVRNDGSGQVSGEFVGHAVGKIILIGVTRQIFEQQYHQRHIVCGIYLADSQPRTKCTARSKVLRDENRR
jgi:hypothetical protein